MVRTVSSRSGNSISKGTEAGTYREHQQGRSTARRVRVKGGAL